MADCSTVEKSDLGDGDPAGADRAEQRTAEIGAEGAAGTFPADAPAAATRVDSGHRPRRGPIGFPGIGAGIGVCVLLALAVAVSSRLRQVESAAVLDEPESSRRAVNVTRPEQADDMTLTLPANIDAFQTTSLYSRVNGYLRRWLADIGDQVQKGQVLAEIDTPELDQELAQARASLVQGRADLDTAVAELQEAEATSKQSEADIARAKANLEYARAVRERNERLDAQHAVASQEVDESRRDYDARRADLDAAEAQARTRQATVATHRAKIKSREATVQALEASVRRLEELEAFKTIAAPFDGMVIRRRAEIGMLVASGGTTTSQELYALAQSDTVRIRAHVPQSQIATIQVGRKAEVVVPEFPDRKFTATVARTARAIDPASRTLMVELELPNADHALLPGTFAQVTLSARLAEPVWSIPASVLLARPDGLKIAVVDAQSIVRIRKVKLGRDYGSRVQVLSGLRGDESMVVNPADDLADNEPVTIAAASGSGSAPKGQP